MSNTEIPGSRHLSAKAKKIWREYTSEENLPHFRQVVFNVIHEYCFFICHEAACEGCKVAELRSWLSSLKVLPQSVSIPVVRELDQSKVEAAESEAPYIEVEKSNAVEPEES